MPVFLTSRRHYLCLPMFANSFIRKLSQCHIIKQVINNHDFVIQFWPAAWRGQIFCASIFPLAVTFTPVMAAHAQHAVQPRLSMGNTTVTADNNVEKMSRRLPQMPGHF